MKSEKKEAPASAPNGATAGKKESKEAEESKEAKEDKADSSKLKAESSKEEVVQEAIEFDDKKEDDSVEEKIVSPDTETAS